MVVHKHEEQDWLSGWHVAPTLNRDYDFIDGLRGIAILLVLADHLLYANPNSALVFQWIHNIAIEGGYGVALFFALSGFLISWPFWKRTQKSAKDVIPKGYAQRRFWKIYPPLALTVVGLAAFKFGLTGDWTILRECLFWITGMAFFLRVSPVINPVLWSLQVEIWFYAILPCLFFVLRGVGASARLVVLPLAFLIVPPIVGPLLTKIVLFSNYVGLSFLGSLHCFAIGVFIAGAENLGLLKKGLASLADVGLILLGADLVAAGTYNTFRGTLAYDSSVGSYWIAITACGLTVLYVADPQHPRVKLLSSRPLRWVGIISFELYLVHQQVFLAMRAAIGQGGGSRLKYLATVVPSVLISVLIAAMFYRYVSLPILRFGRHRSGRPGR